VKPFATQKWLPRRGPRKNFANVDAVQEKGVIRPENRNRSFVGKPVFRDRRGSSGGPVQGPIVGLLASSGTGARTQKYLEEKVLRRPGFLKFGRHRKLPRSRATKHWQPARGGALASED
jgi:hypothetical protein